MELLNDVPDDASINVLNEDGELSANIEVFYETLEKRKYVELIDLVPLWKGTGDEG
jgi:hypothetical protein